MRVHCVPGAGPVRVHCVPGAVPGTPAGPRWRSAVRFGHRQRRRSRLPTGPASAHLPAMFAAIDEADVTAILAAFDRDGGAAPTVPRLVGECGAGVGTDDRPLAASAGRWRGHTASLSAAGTGCWGAICSTGGGRYRHGPSLGLLG